MASGGMIPESSRKLAVALHRELQDLELLPPP